MSDKPEQIAAIERCLQSAFDADPSAMHALCVNRVPCNQTLADHPQVVVDETPVLARGLFSVGAVGLINGVLDAAGIPWVAGYQLSAELDEDGRRKMTGFTMTPRKP
jgi:hypothetical protein